MILFISIFIKICRILNFHFRNRNFYITIYLSNCLQIFNISFLLICQLLLIIMKMKCNSNFKFFVGNSLVYNEWILLLFLSLICLLVHDLILKMTISINIYVHFYDPSSYIKNNKSFNQKAFLQLHFVIK